jgi:hypothetical protein
MLSELLLPRCPPRRHFFSFPPRLTWRAPAYRDDAWLPSPAALPSHSAVRFAPSVAALETALAAARGGAFPLTSAEAAGCARAAELGAAPLRGDCAARWLALAAAEAGDASRAKPLCREACAVLAALASRERVRVRGLGRGAAPPPPPPPPSPPLSLADLVSLAALLATRAGGPREAAQLLWAAARLGACPPPARSALLRAAAAGAPGMAPRHAARALSAAALMSGGVGEGARAELQQATSALLARLVGAFAPGGGEGGVEGGGGARGNGHDAAEVLCAAARLRVGGEHRALVADALAVAGRGAEELGAESAAACLGAAAACLAGGGARGGEGDVAAAAAALLRAVEGGDHAATVGRARRAAAALGVARERPQLR